MFANIGKTLKKQPESGSEAKPEKK